MLHQKSERLLQETYKSGLTFQAQSRDRQLTRSIEKLASRDRAGNSISRATRLRFIYSFGNPPTFETKTDAVSRRDIDYYKYETSFITNRSLQAQFILFNSSSARISLQILDEDGKVVRSPLTKASTTIQPFTSNGFTLTIFPGFSFPYDDQTYYIRVSTRNQQKASYTLNYVSQVNGS